MVKMSSLPAAVTRVTSAVVPRRYWCPWWPEITRHVSLRGCQGRMWKALSFLWILPNRGQKQGCKLGGRGGLGTGLSPPCPRGRWPVPAVALSGLRSCACPGAELQVGAPALSLEPVRKGGCMGGKMQIFFGGVKRASRELSQGGRFGAGPCSAASAWANGRVPG